MKRAPWLGRTLILAAVWCCSPGYLRAEVPSPSAATSGAAATAPCLPGGGQETQDTPPSVPAKILSPQDLAALPVSHFAIPPLDDGLPGVGPIRRYDWFQQLWTGKRSAWAKRVQEDQGALVFLGDSITQGWNDDFSGAFANTKVANRGISGDTTRGMLIRLHEDVLSLQPRGVVLLAGTNDLEEKATPPQIAENLRSIIAQISAADAHVPIVLCLVFPSSESKSRSAEQIREVNRLYQAAVKNNPQVTVVDTWTQFAGPDGNATPDLFPDLLHPNAEGYQKWAQSLRPHLEVLGLVDSVDPSADAPPTYLKTLPANAIRLYNESDLTGWSYQPSTDEDRKLVASWRADDPNVPAWPLLDNAESFTGKAASTDGRYRAEGPRLSITCSPEGRKVQHLWTETEFTGDFDLYLQFRAMPNADSGVFLRGRQLQCRDFLRAGPYRELKNFRDLQWNDMLVQVRGDKARCLCNDEVLEAEYEVPRQGRIGLEADRGLMEYRHLYLVPVTDN